MVGSSTSSIMGELGKWIRTVAWHDSCKEGVLPRDNDLLVLHFQYSSSPKINRILWAIYCLKTLWKSFEIAGYIRKLMLELTVKRA